MEKQTEYQKCKSTVHIGDDSDMQKHSLVVLTIPWLIIVSLFQRWKYINPFKPFTFYIVL